MKRVVITGLGAVTPLGNNIQDFWQNAVAGKSAAATITRFDPTKFKTRFACEVKDFNPAEYLERNEIKRSDLFTQYALYAAAQAMEDSGLDLSKMDPFDVGVIWGSGQGGMGTFEEEVTKYVQNGFEPRFSPFFVPKLIVNMASGMISMKYGLQGMNYTTVSACATSNTSIMDAFNYIRMGKAKAFVTGGSEAPITPASMGGFSALKAMSTNNDHPEAASRPFDVDRDGFVMGEGAGALILEEYEHAKARGAHIYAEMVGAAMTADAFHMTATHPEGIGAIKAMELALEEAQLNPDKVNYLNVHATSTPVGDPSEVTAVQKVFGEKPLLNISATKSMTGHLLGAAGAAESILCIKAITDNIVPPTINTVNLDPAIPKDVRIITGESIDAQVDVAMTNSFGFGGHNATLIFKKI
ncbi:beta-ketoacyl-ACP synthase II [Prolixibacter denitrificans]|uniref:3-oxoacyl-[acyl-carrier-protein] synthase 2 n=1 Tax=Prolixibacter denitrificans TaxID=1541063 RepID=A0A2P8C771_9BACT|nr:beta-ketoacyl-ACP synthase II [Prolixibacter denitrificans]PSK80805.1 3-oxoacyl-[acyl-carrier-protein] synthase II [Prolixibacter denitrificans]GET22395.1 3-oxoacyl-[acyl-carrier-protein] synthase 2 [Prolixibacter denitrificans]